MATATKKKKKQIKNPRTARATRKAPKASANGKAAGQSEKFAPNQTPLIPDADERIEVLDEECQRYLSEKEKQSSAKSTSEEVLEKIGDLIKEHGLELYIHNGKKFYIEPGAPSVKVVNVKQRGN